MTCVQLYGTPSTWVHSFYQRRVDDLLCCGQRVWLLRHVRKCFLASYETHLRTRWVKGVRNAVGLFREVAARG